MVYDFGGGTLDVALVKVGNYVLETLAIAGDSHLGGQDIDNALVSDLIKKYAVEYEEENDTDLNITPRLLAKFKQSACELKIELSAEKEADFGVYTPDFFVDGYTREEFLKVC